MTTIVAAGCLGFHGASTVIDGLLIPAQNLDTELPYPRILATHTTT
jgi:hypothetical protein